MGLFWYQERINEVIFFSQTFMNNFVYFIFFIKVQKEFLITRLQISPTVIVVLDILYKMRYQIDTLYQ